MSKAHKKIILWILIFSAALIFYVRSVPQISLSERAIVVGLGIDYDAEKGYTLTAQIINPINRGQAGGASDGYGIVDATAETMAVAIDMIGEKTGLTVSLSQCNILILGKSLLETDVFPSINYLLQTFQIPEQSILSVTDSAAGDLLRAKPILTTISAFYLQQTLTTMDENEGVINTDIKDFSALYLAKNGAPVITLVSKKELPSDSYGGQTSESATNEKYYQFDYGSCVAFSQGKTPLILDSDDTKAINLILKKVTDGDEMVYVDDKVFTVRLTSKKYSKKVKFENGRLNYSGKLEIKYIFSDTKNFDNYKSVEELPDELIEKIEKEVGRQIENRIKKTYEKTKAVGFDVYGIYGAGYAAEGVRWKNAAQENYFDIIDFNISAKIKVNKK